MFKIIWVHGYLRAHVSENGPSAYGKPRLFKTKKSAEKWIEEHTKPGSDSHYIIEKVNE